MELKMTTFALLLLLASSVRAQPGIFDVTKYGAAPNGDITQVRWYWVYIT